MDEKVTSQVGDLKRLMVRAFVVAMFGSVIGFGTGGPVVAAGAFVGCLAAGFYASGYLRSHVNTQRAKMMDLGIAKSAMFRLVLVFAIGGGLYVFGKQPAIAYVAGFAITFAIVVAFEIPKTMKAVRSGSVSNPVGPSRPIS
ncbi:MAG: hypothetical protein ABR507_10495 [Actinomycetota bacterium]|nr:hypothetical protein [Actinomycetota bacterium]